MSNAQELYQTANGLDKDELVSLLVETQMKLDLVEKQRYEDNEKARGVITEVCNENKELKEKNDTLEQLAQDPSEETAAIVKRIVKGFTEEINKFKEQKDKKIAHLDEELTLSNTALEMVKDENEVNKKNLMKFMEENKTLKQYKKYYDKWSPVLSDIDGDDFCDLLKDCGWEYNEECELVRSED